MKGRRGNMKVSKLWLDPKKCKGCLRCELACSFHKSGHKFFNLEISSTKITRNNNNKEITMMIDETCDLCENEKIPLCIKYCPFGARGIIK
jgi:carbon-monoxide dehydrogenase iron sulfur subunit